MQREPAEFSVYSGRDAIGFCRPIGSQFEAVTAAGRSLGLYNTGRAAADALALDAAQARRTGGDSMGAA